MEPRCYVPQSGKLLETHLTEQGLQQVLVGQVAKDVLQKKRLQERIQDAPMQHLPYAAMKFKSALAPYSIFITPEKLLNTSF